MQFHSVVPITIEWRRRANTRVIYRGGVFFFFKIVFFVEIICNLRPVTCRTGSSWPLSIKPMLTIDIFRFFFGGEGRGEGFQEPSLWDCRANSWLASFHMRTIKPNLLPVAWLGGGGEERQHNLFAKIKIMTGGVNIFSFRADEIIKD